MIAVALACLAGWGRARRQAPAQVARGGRGPTAAEFAELKQRVDQQNELIMQLTQIESQHYEIPAQAAPEQPARAVAPIALPRKRPALAPPVGDAPRRDRRPRRPRSTTLNSPAAPPEARRPSPAASTSRERPGARPTSTSRTSRSRAVDRTVEIAQKDRAFVPNVLARAARNARLVSQRRSVPAQRVLAVADVSRSISAATARARSRAWSGCSRRASSRCCATCTRRCARTSSSSPTATT